MGSDARKLDWPAIRRRFEEQGMPLAPGALPFWFGNDARMARELGELVASGPKRGTAGLVWAWEAEGLELPGVGQVFVVLDWEGEPLAVVRYTRVEVLAFRDVDAEFAATEGEGDGSLKWWREAHWRYFSAECEALGHEASPDMPVVCQCFEVLWPAEAREL
jgi:uncharacterized protein YhfF